MKSMTGYGEATRQSQRARITVQLRTVNHRHLDLQLRLPREYLALEEELRRKLRQRISRGRVELFITRSPTGDMGRRLALDERLGGQYLAAIRGAQKKFALKGEVDLGLFFHLPQLFNFQEEDRQGDAEKSAVLSALDTALGNLQRSRQREGTELKKDIRLQVGQLQKICGGIAREVKEMERRLNESALPRRDAGALAMDAALDGPAQTTLLKDINEEVVRLKSHLATLSHLLPVREPLGKRIEFLLQEVQRELNTISSKTPHLPVIQLVLAGKERAEKIREQIQNIE